MGKSGNINIYAVKIINFRMKHKNSDNINVKFLMQESNNIDSLIQEIKEK